MSATVETSTHSIRVRATKRAEPHIVMLRIFADGAAFRSPTLPGCQDWSRPYASMAYAIDAARAAALHLHREGLAAAARAEPAAPLTLVGALQAAEATLALLAGGKLAPYQEERRAETLTLVRAAVAAQAQAA